MKTLLDGFLDSFKTGGTRAGEPSAAIRQPAVPPGNDASRYGVQVEPAAVAPGQPYWRAVSVHHLTPEENHGNHHIYVDVLEAPPEGLGAPGKRLFNARLKVTWEGGESIVTVDKPLGEPGGNYPMWKSQDCAVEALGLQGQELPSDRVTGLHTRHPDEAPGNTWGHHSFLIIFVRTQAPVAPKARGIISGKVLRGAGRMVLLRREGVEVTRQAVGGDNTYRFTGLSAGVYRVGVADTAIASPPLTLADAADVTADLALPAANKPLAHYVLFGPAEQPETAVNLLLAQDFLLALRPVFGFSPAEAAAAAMVTIIGDERAVSAQVAGQLAAGGAKVMRIAGPADRIALALAERANPM